MTQVLPLNTGTPIVDDKGMPTEQFIKMWQKLIAQGNLAAGALMPQPAPVTIYTDFAGTILAGELPRTFSIKRYLYAVDVSSRTRWFISVKSGSISATITQLGAITITSAGAGGVLTIKSVRDSVTLQCDITVNIAANTPPTTGVSGGGSSTTTTFGGISASTMASITADVSVVVGSGGIANLQATLSVRTARSLPVNGYGVYGIWRWWNGTAYVDVSTEVRTSPDASVTQEGLGDFGGAPYIYYMSPGSLNVTSSKSGLVAASTAKFQFFARNDVSTSIRAMTFTGTATATGA